jgi:hypothetical protein
MQQIRRIFVSAYIVVLHSMELQEQNIVQVNVEFITIVKVIKDYLIIFPLQYYHKRYLN